MKAILFFLFPIAALAQHTPEKYPELMMFIKHIDSDTSLRKVVIGKEEFSMSHIIDSAEATGYYADSQLVKITRTTWLPYGIETNEYYFRDGELAFIHETNNDYFVSEDGQKNYDSVGQRYIGLYYFKNKKLVDIESIGHNRFDSNDYDMEKTLLAETLNWVLAFQAKTTPTKNSRRRSRTKK